MQDDGNFVIYQGSTVKFDTTSCYDRITALENKINGMFTQSDNTLTINI